MNYRTTLAGRALSFALLALLLSASTAFGQEASVYTLQVDGLACPFCAYGIEKQLQSIEGLASAETEIKTGTVIITMHEGATLTEEDAKKAVEDAGFKFRGLTPKGRPG